MKKNKYLIAAIFPALLLALGLWTILSPQKTMSENENRTLALFPHLTLTSLWDGSFRDELSDALTDQFPGREAWISVATALKKAAGRRDISDVYEGADGFLFEKVTAEDISQKRYENNLSVIDDLAKQLDHIPFSVLLVPPAAEVYTEKLPAFAPLCDVDALYDRAAELLTHAELYNPTDALKKAAKTGQVYYRTDHHWTCLGAYTAYTVLTEGKGAYGKLRGETVSGDFYGSLFSKTLDKTVSPDEIFLPEAEDSFFDYEKLSIRDKYQVFLGGNEGIATYTGTGKGKIIIVKDSFANCFIPFLGADYEEITVIDPRYYSGTLQELVADTDYDRVLFLYEITNLAQDTAVSRITMERQIFYGVGG